MADVATRKPIPLVNNILPDSALNTLNIKVNVRLITNVVGIYINAVTFAVKCK